MTPAQIRDYAVAASIENGINPSVTLGLIEHVSSFATKYDRGGKLGLMGVPRNEVEDKASYLANPKSQIDSGLVRLAALKGEGTDIEGLVNYTQDPKLSMKALMRGLKATTEPVSREAMQAMYEATGSRGNIDQDAKKYGFQFTEPQPEIVEPPIDNQAIIQPEQMQQELRPQEAYSEPEQDYSMYVEDDGEDAVEALFGDKPQSGTPPDVLKQLEAIAKE
jgi:hypothetical protein